MTGFKIMELVLGFITAIIPIVPAWKGFNNRSLKNIKEQYEYFKEIIQNADDKMLSFTCLKTYIGFSIPDEMITFIIKSTDFYEIVTALKNNLYPYYINFDGENEKIVYKKGKQPQRWLFCIIFLVSFMLPFTYTTFFMDTVNSYKDLIVITILSIPCAVFAVASWIEIRDRSSAINLINRLNTQSKNSLAKQTPPPAQ